MSSEIFMEIPHCRRYSNHSKFFFFLNIHLSFWKIPLSHVLKDSVSMPGLQNAENLTELAKSCWLQLALLVIFESPNDFAVMIFDNNLLK